MAGKIQTDTAQLIKCGGDFVTYAGDLTKILNDIRAQVTLITEGGLQGKAQAKLIDTYEQIDDELIKYPKKLNQIGESLQTSAKNEAAIDEAAATAATISM